MNLSAVTIPRNLKGSMLTRFVGVGVVLDTTAKSLANADYVDNSPQTRDTDGSVGNVTGVTCLGRKGVCFGCLNLSPPRLVSAVDVDWWWMKRVRDFAALSSEMSWTGLTR